MRRNGACGFLINTGKNYEHSRKMQRRILFLMHIDWYWIKQRPQFLAEQLSKKHSVLVLYRLNPFRKQLIKTHSAISKLPFLPVPIRLFRGFEKVVQRWWLTIISWFFEPNILWITFPDMVEYLPRRLQKLPIVYDCMDYAPGFFSSEKQRKNIQQLEKQLGDRAKIIFCSSKNIQKILRKKNPYKRIVLLRNAVTTDFLEGVYNVFGTDEITGSDDSFNVAYWGTISHWLDYDALLFCLDRIPSLKIHLIGVLETALPFKHERLILHPPIPHQDLFYFSRRFQALLLPFKVSSLIQGVDPVKLYEYIATGKEIVAVRYPEIERFSSYVHFYDNKESFASILADIFNGKSVSKTNLKKRLKFLEENTWEIRMKIVERVFEEQFCYENKAC